MGCGNSTPVNSKNNSLATLSNSDSRPGSKTIARNKSLESVLRDNENRSDSRTSNRDSGIDSAKTSDGRRRQPANHASNPESVNGTSLAPLSNNNSRNSPQKALAFEVMVDSQTNQGESNQSIIAKHPPKRLQRLDLVRENTLTAEMIEEKQRASEERRREALAERGKSSKKSSRRRRELMIAKQFGNIQESADISHKLEEKIDSASKNRAKVHADVIAKQKKRELRAKQARERARRQQEDENAETQFVVEKDENFNADDDIDSWLDGDNNNALGSASTTSERIYDGRSSPTKKISRTENRAGKSLNFDSEEEEDQGWAAKAYGGGQLASAKDEFFDA